MLDHMKTRKGLKAHSSWESSVFWLSVFCLLGLLIWVAVCWAKKREEPLSSIPEAVRKRFEEREKFRLVQRSIKQDVEGANEAIRAIEVAQAERRSYARVWISEFTAGQVERWGERHELNVIRVKTKKDKSIQLSLSGFSKDQKFE